MLRCARKRLTGIPVEEALASVDLDDTGAGNGPLDARVEFVMNEGSDRRCLGADILGTDEATRDRGKEASGGLGLAAGGCIRPLDEAVAQGKAVAVAVAVSVAVDDNDNDDVRALAVASRASSASSLLS
jgi:hypothetical protein